MDHDMGINLETRGDESREQIDEETRVEIDESEEAIVERLTNDDYEFWRSTTPFLYNLVASHKTEWPSLTVEWLPDRVEPYGGDYLVQKIILGTHTANNVPNCLMLAQVKLPLFNDWTNDAEFGTSGKV
ncbi:hypothetical protein L6452_01434 [Arctium lappa]|uniref:Uncharacterized protein n=1 Tax=Arctium lappa TaxID=4217 RepID=A0ACB9FHY8_ARCLA|nr:hypothetical protein L6452_01434 [Arctium lappa]